MTTITMKRLAASGHHKLTTRLQAHRRTKKIRASPRRVFVDCGANTCTVLRDFVKELPDFEFFAFEAQPDLKSEGERAIRDHPDTRIQYANKAVWIRNETLNFYLATEWGKNFRGGSTLVTGNTMNQSAIDYDSPVQVEAFDFSAWLGANFCPQDYVIVKMDIEGAEYDVLEKVIADGNLPVINELIIEFHHGMNTDISEERHDALVETLTDTLDRLERWY